MATLDPQARFYTADVALFEVNGDEVLAIFRDCRIRTNWDIVDARIPRDINDPGSMGFKYNRSTRREWSCELGTVLEKLANTIILLRYAVLIVSGAEVNRGLMGLSITRPGGTVADPSYQGLGYFTDARFSLSENSPIMQNGTITGYGPLSPE